MATKLFECYGRFCANYALEVLVCFLTMVVAAITLNVSSPYELCHWATNCTRKLFSENEISSDVVLLAILRCGTIIYVYMQLKKLWKIKSAVLVSIVCMYTVFAVMTFSVTVMHFLKKDIVVVSNALPVFLLLIDVSRMVTITQHALSVKSIDMLHDYISKAMGALTPVLTLDTLVELLILINIGIYVQIYPIQQLTCFACLSLIINYIVFTTFVPSSLSVLLTAINKSPTNEHISIIKPSWHDVRFKSILETELNGNKRVFSNKVKVALCLALLILNASRNYLFTHEAQNEMQVTFDFLFTLTPEQFFTVVLILILSSKYMFDDGYEIMTKLRKQSDTKSENLPHEKMPMTTCDEVVSSQVVVEESNFVSQTDTSPRSLEECLELLKVGSDLLSDEEIIDLVHKRKLAIYKLESELRDANRAVSSRRQIYSISDVTVREALNHVPYLGYDFTKATKACCENTVGFIPVPIGIVGPLLLNGHEIKVPMATTEGTLLASTNRGLKALFLSGGVKGCIYNDGMTRAPVVSFSSIERTCEMSAWLHDNYNFNLVKEKFDETSRFVALKRLMPMVSGRDLFIRFIATTGDAMGMNMVSKATENALKWLKTDVFQDMEVVSLSGNLCTDKKSSSINWIEGRGKSVVCEAELSAGVVKNVLKTETQHLIRANHKKNYIGSARSGSIGGFNAHAANVVTAVFIATGQDPAQIGVSSNCITTMELISSKESRVAGDSTNSNQSLLVTCTMPSLEVGTLGGGTNLEPQKACLKLMGIAGSSRADKPGENAAQLARIICATVLAGELSLMSALCTGDLVQSHMQHNRLSKVETRQETDHSIL